MKSDPILDRVRAVRHEISARFDHDPKRLTAYYIARQERHKERLIHAEPARIKRGRTTEEGGLGRRVPGATPSQ